jgi:sortase (surface protein transpeptidase)
MVVGLTPAAVTFHRDDGGVRSGVTIPEHGGAVLPGSAPFGSGRWTGVAGHSSRPDGPGDFAPLLMAEAGDVLVGCNTDGQCWRYRVTRVERLDETALNRLLEERSGDLLVHTCDTNLTHYIVLTGETYD